MLHKLDVGLVIEIHKLKVALKFVFFMYNVLLRSSIERGWTFGV